MICNYNQCYQLLGRGGNTKDILFANDESKPYNPKYSKLHSPYAE